MNNDSFEKLANIIKENNLCDQALDYLVDIKRALEEKEIVEMALNKACYELECAEGIIKDLRNIINSICCETQDRIEWRNRLIRDSAIELE